MRIWSTHPEYLDSKGLIALWRESLLAKNVLAGLTKGYKNHPQLIRFKKKNPLKSINTYIYYIYLESLKRNYSFNKAKFQLIDEDIKIEVNDKQVEYEFKHLLKKLKGRDFEMYKKVKTEKKIKAHPMFVVKKGEIEDWERVKMRRYF